MKTHSFRTLCSVIALTLASFAFCVSSKADVTYTFTGTGSLGSVAFGQFTLPDSALVPGSASQSIAFPSLSLSIDNILDLDGENPGSVFFDELPFTWYSVAADGTVYIAPMGSVDFGAPNHNSYKLFDPVWSNFPGSAVVQTHLNWSTPNHSWEFEVITWSTATRMSSPVPESGSTAAYLLVASVIAGAARFRRFRR